MIEPKNIQPRDIDTAEVSLRLSRQLRRLIGTGRRWSYSGVSELTGIDVRSLRAYVHGTACPNLAKYKRLLAVLGPEMSVEIDQMYGWRPRASTIPPEHLDIERVIANLRESLSIIDKALEGTAPIQGSDKPE